MRFGYGRINFHPANGAFLIWSQAKALHEIECLFATLPRAVGAVCKGWVSMPVQIRNPPLNIHVRIFIFRFRIIHIVI